MNHHLNQQDKEISSMQRQMDSLMRERDFLALESAVCFLCSLFQANIKIEKC